MDLTTACMCIITAAICHSFMLITGQWYTELQVKEVNLALTWALDNLKQYNADTQRLSVFGHSAGAHLIMMALLHRAASARRNQDPLQSHEASSQAHSLHSGIKDDAQQCSIGKASSPAKPVQSVIEEAAVQHNSHDARMPAQAILAAGVYDIQMHYEYESVRGVHMLSTMERAMGGWHACRARSPSLLVQSVAHGRSKSEAVAGVTRSALHQHATAHEKSSAIKDGEKASDGGAATHVLAESLSGDTGGCAALQPADGAQPLTRNAPSVLPMLQHLLASHPNSMQSSGAPDGTSAVPAADLLNPPERIHFAEHFACDGGLIAHRTVGALSGSACSTRMQERACFDKTAGEPAERFAAHLCADDIAALPPLTFMTGTADLTVPWYESVEMQRYAASAGAKARLLMYNSVGHIDWVTGWQASGQTGLQGFQQDIVRLVHQHKAQQK